MLRRFDEHRVVAGGAAAGALGLIGQQIARRGANHIIDNVGRAWNNFRQDQRHDRQDEARGGDQEVPQESTLENSAPQGMMESRGGAAAAGIGYRGALTGNGQYHQGYSHHYHESIDLHSRKVKNLTWCYSLFAPGNNPNPTNFAPIQAYGNNFFGQGYIDNNINAGVNIGPATPFAYNPNSTITNSTRFSLQDPANNVCCNPINFIVDDFVDNKLLDFDNTQKGIMSNYIRLRLKNFTIQISPVPFGVSFVDQRPDIFINNVKTEGKTYEQPGIFSPSTSTVPTNTAYASVARQNYVDQDYWVYRDVYNDFTTEADLTNVPAYPSAAQNDGAWQKRSVHSVRNLDTYLSIMSNKEPYSYTREINSKAAYYIPVAQLVNLKNTNIQVLVNYLEGITPDNAGIATGLPESFNLLVGPCQAEMHKVVFNDGGEGGKTFIHVTPRITTSLYIKTLATWEAFDFQYTTGPQKIGEFTSTKVSETITKHEELIRQIKQDRNSF